MRQKLNQKSAWKKRPSGPDLAVSLYDRLTGRGAEITYEFQDMDVAVPSKVGEGADHAHWNIDRILYITTVESD